MKVNHHKFRFGIRGNFRVLICRIFGHKLNSNYEHHWCERCGLAYEEIYHPKNYRDTIKSNYSIEILGDNGDVEEISIPFTLFQLIRMTSEERDYYRTLVEGKKIHVSPK